MRLIGADELLKNGRRHSDGMRSGRIVHIPIVSVSWKIEDAPTIDPEELRTRGHWIDLSPEQPQWAKSFKCSNCGGFVDDERYDYCPRCGARMEVEHE